jgi:predicted Zn-dependent peptidase
MKKLRYDRIGETVFSERLENGLQIFVVSKPGFAKSYAFFTVNYGGMDMRFQSDGAWQDTPAGVAHFLEHKMFDTKDGNALQELAANGASPNAFTSPAMTAYHFESTEKFADNLRVLLTFVSEPWFTKESVEKEQGIIGQEIRMGDDSPDVRVYYGLMESLYKDLPIRVNVAGTVESIAEITPDTLYSCHKAFYNPANMCLVAVGDVDPEAVVTIARDTLTRKAGIADIPRDYGPAEAPAAASSRFECRMEVASPLFLAGWKCDVPPKGREGLRANLLGDLVFALLAGDSSPLYARLYAEGLINKSFGGAWERMPGGACFVCGGESRDPDAVARAIAEERDRIVREGIATDLYSRVKKALYGTRLRGLNSFENISVELSQSYFDDGSYYDFPELFDSISKADVERYIAENLSPERFAISVIRPVGETEQGEAAAQEE